LEREPGKIICISAGNEREDKLHLGGWFNQREEQTIEFEVFRPDDPTKAPGAKMSIWHDGVDKFSLTLFAPDGSEFVAPDLGQLDEYQGQGVLIRIGRGWHLWNNLRQTQIVLSFSKNAHPVKDLLGWKLKILCERAVVGRLDAWFNNSGHGVFLSHPLVEQARTISLPATGKGCITVASYITKTQWNSDDGLQTRSGDVLGRTSSFSSMGPTRDGRSKPDISAQPSATTPS